jgi:hypothetical protein
VFVLLVPLLESEGRWAELAEALAQDASLVPRAERAPILARLGLVRWKHLGDTPAAVEAFTEALAIDDRESSARAALEKINGPRS